MDGLGAFGVAPGVFGRIAGVFGVDEIADDEEAADIGRAIPATDLLPVAGKPAV